MTDAARTLSFFIRGLPIGQGNHRTSRYGKVYETTKGHAGWRHDVAQAAMLVRKGPAWTEPVSLGLEFVLLRPRHCPRARTVPSVKPDLSKLIRGLEDGLVEGGLLADDALIVELAASKRYAQPGTDMCGVNVQLASWNGER